MAKKRRVFRHDNIQLEGTYYTPEGYLIDHPIVTSVGIFEYLNPDGTTRKELRLPEHVFNKKSLESYEGKPIIVTHDAQEVDKNNVDEEQIGTVLTSGYKDGDDVRAKIIIHQADVLKRCKFRELSLGYSLDLDETPGTWNGQKYDAIQTNIRINHLALVDNARAGEQARLNIDSKEPELKGEKMKTSKRKVVKKNRKNVDSKKRSIPQKKRRTDNGLSPEELAEAIALYQERKATDEEENVDEDVTLNPDEVVEMIMDRRDMRDDSDDPEDIEDAMHVIAQMDEDIESLLNVVAELQGNNADEDDNTDEDDNVDEDDNCDEDDNTDEDDNLDEDDNYDEDDNTDEDDNMDDDTGSSLNADSVDRLVRQRVEFSKLGERLRIDGIDKMSPRLAKKKIIKAVSPKVRLDGKSDAYLDAAYDIAKSQAMSRKDTNSQRKQMSKKRRTDSCSTGSSAKDARQRMIEGRGMGGK